MNHAGREEEWDQQFAKKRDESHAAVVARTVSLDESSSLRTLPCFHAAPTLMIHPPPSCAFTVIHTHSAS